MLMETKQKLRGQQLKKVWMKKQNPVVDLSQRASEAA